MPSHVTKKIRWGILGTGNIARQFATGVRSSTRGVLATVGSRTQTTADEFAKTYAIPISIGSYEQLINDQSYDALYISTPNTMHHEWTIKALRAGKHVLCEKPIGANHAEAQEMFDVAKKTGRVLTEAFMYRAHPQTLRMMELIRAGEIGSVRHVRTSFCYHTKKIDGNIRFDASLAGGAIMDIGCYCVSFARLIAGSEPTEVNIIADNFGHAVDVFATGTMRFANHLTSSFTFGMNTQADNAAHVLGDEGHINVPVPWKPAPGKGVIIVARQTPPKQDGAGASASPVRSVHVDDDRDVYAVEADAFAQCILETNVPFMSPDDSLSNMLVLDLMRKQAGSSFTGKTFRHEQ